MVPLETAVDAVLELDREHGGSLARGAVVEARIETGPEAGLALAVRYANSVDDERRRYPLAAVAAAVIHYCWRMRIPLPRHGTKSIEVTAEGFTIIIQGTVEVLRLHGPIPQAALGSQRVDAPATPSQTEEAAMTPPVEAVPAAPATKPA